MNSMTISRPCRSAIPVFLVALAGCPLNGDPDLVCNQRPAAVSAQQAWTLVMRDAACTACHHEGSDTPFNFSSGEAFRTSTVSVTSKYGRELVLIRPGKLAESVLWLKVLGGADTGMTGPRGESVGGRMPPGGGWPLSTESKEMLKDWICTGAPL